MRVLWVVNTIFPDISEKLGISKPNFGGWMYSLANDLKNVNEIDLYVATVYKGSKSINIEAKGIEYYLIPLKGKKSTEYSDDMKLEWEKIIGEIKPDVIHLHGTEYSHGLALINSTNNRENIVASIQGLVSVYERYYYAGIDIKDILRNITFKDIVTRNSLIQQRIKFKKRGKIEKTIIESLHNIIGRTSWDFSHSKALNNNINYYFCNESLRDSFYKKNWGIDNIKRNSIFLSQAAYPIKGLHIVIKACGLIKEKYPNIIINIAGDNIMKRDTLKEKIKIGGYAKYLEKLIDKYGMRSNIRWLGQIDEKEMSEQMEKSHIFICPSAIENSPNSLGEAQLIGVPTIAAISGGVPDMISNNYDGITYRFEEYEMLANIIDEAFSNDDLLVRISKNGIVRSAERHSREKNLLKIIEIYKDIISNGGK